MFALFYDWAYTGHGFPMIGSGENRYQLMDVDDLDHAIWNAMTYPKEVVATEFNIGAKEFTTMKEVPNFIIAIIFTVGMLFADSNGNVAAMSKLAAVVSEGVREADGYVWA